MEKISYYRVFIRYLISPILQLEKKIAELKSSNDRVLELSSKQVNDLKVKHVASCKAFHDLWDISVAESQRIIDKIEHQVNGLANLSEFVFHWCSLIAT